MKSIFVESVPKDPASLTYLELRKAVGLIAFFMPFAVALPRLILRHTLEGSISAYYYTGSRNLFVGALCAIAMFLLCCRGFDRKDLIAGIAAAVFALGVAFFPTKPVNPTPQQMLYSHVHVISATLLFLTLAVFCLWLFRIRAEGREISERKKKRNVVYTVCGLIILGSMAGIAVCWAFGISVLFGVGPWFVFETTALVAFGVAWMTKGQFILQEEKPKAMEVGTVQELVTK